MARQATGVLIVVIAEGQRMKFTTTAAASAALCLSVLSLPVSAIADPAPPDSQNGRFVFSKQGDGFVRLDTQTGGVALCSQQPVGWACQSAPEDRTVLENEIARLRRENIALKKDMLDHGLPLPSGVGSEPPTVQNEQPTVRLPSDADVDRVMAFVARVWQRFVDAVDRAQKQVFNKS
jgi:hypothetical protein